ncbi:MAG: bifunctional metallophosphatase/5'-nucleotidase [Mangrovibacterium sp.]
MSNRRSFLKQAMLFSGGIALASLPKRLMAKEAGAKKLTILHTNDIHCRIDPFAEGTFEGRGGLARLSGMINRIRTEEDNVMLLDSGDMFQGTPYFNTYKGELIFKVMSKMGYQAATMGNHELDNGLESLARAMQHMRFPFVCSNYDFSGTSFMGEFVPYHIFYQKGIKVGVYGLGVELEGMVDAKNFEGIIYNDPIEVAQKMEYQLKEKNKCDLVICLSHLGFEYTNENVKGKISDKRLAPHTKHTDLILGGHTHTYLAEPYIAKNAHGKPVLINQTGWGGLNLGRIDVYFDEAKGEISFVDSTIIENKA